MIAMAGRFGIHRDVLAVESPQRDHQQILSFDLQPLVAERLGNPMGGTGRLDLDVPVPVVAHAGEQRSALEGMSGRQRDLTVTEPHESPDETGFIARVAVQRRIHPVIGDPQPALAGQRKQLRFQDRTADRADKHIPLPASR